jgi:hypothetical protein
LLFLYISANTEVTIELTSHYSVICMRGYNG